MLCGLWTVKAAECMAAFICMCHGFVLGAMSSVMCVSMACALTHCIMACQKVLV